MLMLRIRSLRGARVVSICTGAFALAHAGLLDGRRATTHWRAAALLAERFPRIDVDPNVLYVDDGDVLTSAGVAAGIDLCLHIVRRDHGAEVAARMARRIVVAPHRDGGQAQFVERPVAEEPREGLAATRAWALERVHRPLDVRALAAHAGVSGRTFARRFRAATPGPGCGRGRRRTGGRSATEHRRRRCFKGELRSRGLLGLWRRRRLDRGLAAGVGGGIDLRARRLLRRRGVGGRRDVGCLGRAGAARWGPRLGVRHNRGLRDDGRRRLDRLRDLEVGRHVLRSRFATSRAFSSARSWALASSSFASPLRSSWRP